VENDLQLRGSYESSPPCIPVHPKAQRELWAGRDKLVYPIKTVNGFKKVLWKCPDMRWLRFVGSLKLHVSFAEYSLFCRALLQKRPIILKEPTNSSHPIYSLRLTWYVMICTGRQVLRDFTTRWADLIRNECNERILGRIAPSCRLHIQADSQIRVMCIYRFVLCTYTCEKFESSIYLHNRTLVSSTYTCRFADSCHLHLYRFVLCTYTCTKFVSSTYLPTFAPGSRLNKTNSPHSIHLSPKSQKKKYPQK